jgi:hypothetical protein
MQNEVKGLQGDGAYRLAIADSRVALPCPHSTDGGFVETRIAAGGSHSGRGDMASFAEFHGQYRQTRFASAAGLEGIDGSGTLRTNNRKLG